jgi:hypothetical protein
LNVEGFSELLLIEERLGLGMLTRVLGHGGAGLSIITTGIATP